MHHDSFCQLKSWRQVSEAPLRRDIGRSKGLEAELILR